MRSATIRRRDILTAAAGICAAMIAPAAASHRKRMGWLSASTPSTLPGLALLLTYLSALGWRAGETLEVVSRQAEGDMSKLPRLAAEVVATHPDVIACTGTAEASALTAATSEIPIVFLFVADPLALGIVTSLARPAGNITGIAVAAQNPSVNSLWADAAATASHLTVNIVRVDAGSADEIEPAFDAIANQGTSGIVVPYDFLFTAQPQRIIALAAERRLAAIYGSRTLALEGGLISYGPDLRENLRRGATYIDSILKGASPNELPVYQPSRLELILNLKTAKALGLMVPPAILLRTDELIE
jgi:putative tryptophan/tyrosine transport system substrate-binding protein